jgi:hypothetical protein
MVYGRLNYHLSITRLRSLTQLSVAPLFAAVIRRQQAPCLTLLPPTPHIPTRAHRAQIMFQRATFGGLEDVRGVLQWADPLMADRDLKNAGVLLGKIVIVLRGETTFVEKARRVAAAGGLGMVVVNLSDEFHECVGTAEDVLIPVVCVRQKDTEKLVDGEQVSLQDVRNRGGRGTLCFTETMDLPALR